MKTEGKSLLTPIFTAVDQDRSLSVLTPIVIMFTHCKNGWIHQTRATLTISKANDISASVHAGVLADDPRTPYHTPVLCKDVDDNCQDLRTLSIRQVYLTYLPTE